ncbi:hypothetical protein [Shinella sp. BYT-45]|uniref:hypothetical protein n=1 Tax=Shinella sp. BYT-45 TaxID=3377377 RepID=UPI00397EC3E1
MNATKVPAHIEPYMTVLGVEGGIEFLLQFGGSYVYLSERPQDRSPVVELVGHEKAAALAKRIGAGGLRVPLGKPFIAAYLRANNWSINAIARRLHVSDVSVRKWVNDADDRQMTFLLD